MGNDVWFNYSRAHRTDKPIYKVNMAINSIPRLLHLYWGKDKPLSWLRWLTVRTFAMLNPDWRVIVWHPKKPGRPPQWATKEHSFYSWSGPDWFKRLGDAGSNVETRLAPLDDFPQDMTEVHRSDLLRWRLLHTMGGFWSDIDIVYFRPMLDLKLDYSSDALLCWGEIPELAHWQAIGFLAGAPGSPLFKAMEELGLALAKVPALDYQEFGTNLLLKFAAPGQLVSVGGCRIGQIPQHTVYPFASVRSQQMALWSRHSIMDVRDCTVGIHWFAAQRQSCQREGSWSGASDVEKTAHGGVHWALGQIGLVKPKKEQSLELKYSVIMPYLDRPELLHNTLLSYHHWYGGRKDWEVVIVHDSKCSDPIGLRAVVDFWLARGLDINLLHFDATGMYNPAPLFDLGTRKARGRHFVLTNPETFHDVNILSGLDAEFDDAVDEKYVVCACKNRIQPTSLPVRMRQFRQLREPSDKWLQHSIHRPFLYHFCSALSREAYFNAGGFDSAFAPGFCFDDDDFRDSVIKSGVEIVQRDDLVVSHQWHPSCDVPDKAERWNRNKALYESKHGPYRQGLPPLAAQGGDSDIFIEPSPGQIVFACVLKSGGDFSPQYVSRLKSMIDRNTTMPHRFVCLTDMNVPCDSIRLTEGFPGWWSKLELFKPGQFNNGDTVVYFDLDTIIMGNLDLLGRLPDGFHALRPWNRQNMQRGYCGSGFMVWKGDFSFIFSNFRRAILPRYSGGDQQYISETLSKMGVGFRPLQDGVSGIHSYKRQCRNGPPPGTRVVCFHGRPRVHEVQDRWVREVWK